MVPAGSKTQRTFVSQPLHGAVDEHIIVKLRKKSVYLSIYLSIYLSKFARLTFKKF